LFAVTPSVIRITPSRRMIYGKLRNVPASGTSWPAGAMAASASIARARRRKLQANAMRPLVMLVPVAAAPRVERAPIFIGSAALLIGGAEKVTGVCMGSAS
jgi:hypothetical protein